MGLLGKLVLLRCSGTVNKLVVPRGGGTVIDVGVA